MVSLDDPCAAQATLNRAAGVGDLHSLTLETCQLMLEVPEHMNIFQDFGVLRFQIHVILIRDQDNPGRSNILSLLEKRSVDGWGSIS